MNTPASALPAPLLTAEDRGTFAQTLTAFARTLDSHVERYGDQVLPSILRALSAKEQVVAEKLHAVKSEEETLRGKVMKLGLAATDDEGAL